MIELWSFREGSTDSEKTLYIDEFEPKPRRLLGNNGVREERKLLPRFIKTTYDRKIHQNQHAGTPPSTTFLSNLLEEPPGLEDLEPFHEYHENYKQAVIKNLDTDPREFTTTKPCLVCNKTGHTFDNCPILKNNVSHF